jgi:hypothetical protein
MPLDSEHVECGFGNLVCWCGSELVGRSLRNGAHSRADVDYFLELALFKERDECRSDGVDGENIDVEDMLEIGPVASAVNISVKNSKARSPDLHVGYTALGERHDAGIVHEHVETLVAKDVSSQRYRFLDLLFIGDFDGHKFHTAIRFGNHRLECVGLRTCSRDNLGDLRGGT